MDSVTVAFELMRMELDAEIENLNTEGAKCFRASMYTDAEELIKRGRVLQNFLYKVQALETEWGNSFASTISIEHRDENIEEIARKIIASSKSPKTALLVRFPNGDVIAEEKAADTLVSVIKRVGMEQVEKLGILVNSENIVSRTPSKKYSEALASPFYIKTHSNTAQKKRNIEQIAAALNLELKVEII